MQINAIYCLKIHTLHVKTGIGTINPKSGGKVFEKYRELEFNP